MASQPRHYCISCKSIFPRNEFETHPCQMARTQNQALIQMKPPPRMITCVTGARIFPEKDWNCHLPCHRRVPRVTRRYCTQCSNIFFEKDFRNHHCQRTPLMKPQSKDVLSPENFQRHYPCPSVSEIGPKIRHVGEIDDQCLQQVLSLIKPQSTDRLFQFAASMEKILRRYFPIKEFYLSGSVAMGIHKVNSDVDMKITFLEGVDMEIFRDIQKRLFALGFRCVVRRPKGRDDLTVITGKETATGIEFDIANKLQYDDAKLEEVNILTERYPVLKDFFFLVKMVGKKLPTRNLKSWAWIQLAIVYLQDECGLPKFHCQEMYGDGFESWELRIGLASMVFRFWEWVGDLKEENGALCASKLSAGTKFGFCILEPVPCFEVINKIPLGPWPQNAVEAWNGFIRSYLLEN